MGTKRKVKARNEKPAALLCLLWFLCDVVKIFSGQNYFYDLWTILNAKKNQEWVNVVDEPFLQNVG